MIRQGAITCRRFHNLFLMDLFLRPMVQFDGVVKSPVLIRCSDFIFAGNTMYAIANERSLCFVYGTFNLAIFTNFVTFYGCIKIGSKLKSRQIFFMAFSATVVKKNLISKTL